MRLRSSAFLLPLILLGGSASAAGRAPAQANVPDISVPLQTEPDRFEEPLPTVTQERMTLAEMQAFFDTVEPGVAVRLVNRDGTRYAGNYAGGGTGRPFLLCRKGLGPVESIPLQPVADAFVVVSERRLVRIHRLD